MLVTREAGHDDRRPAQSTAGGALRALDEKLCPDPTGHAWLQAAVSRAALLALEACGDGEVEALILTGSLSRGEGSVWIAPGAYRLLGDVELLTILREPFDWPEARRRMLDLGRRASVLAGDDGGSVAVEYVPAGVSFLRRKIRPCIFAYDLRRHGRVLWGRQDILSEIRPFEVEAIPAEDALALVMNRVVELLMLEADAPLESARSWVGVYQLVKTVLDLAGSALAFAGRYVSSYASRREAFGAFLSSVPELRAALPNAKVFEAELDKAIQCKLAPSSALLAGGDLRERTAAVLAWARGVWTWEARILLGLPGAAFPELIDGYLSRERLRHRLRGWIKYWRHPLRPPGGVDPLRASRLLFKASPHTLAYAAALLGHAAITEGREEWRLRAASLLPVSPAPGKDAVVRQAGETWRWLIRNN